MEKKSELDVTQTSDFSAYLFHVIPCYKVYMRPCVCTKEEEERESCMAV